MQAMVEYDPRQRARIVIADDNGRPVHLGMWNGDGGRREPTMIYGSVDPLTPRTKSDVIRELAAEHGWEVVDIKHAHDWEFSSYCGAHICIVCGDHAHVRPDGTVSQELARCFCGWNLAPGERLEDDADAD